MKRLLEGKKLEWMILILFAACLVFISAFHEPWFDEAQAWEIAKGASFKEILFTIPHFEGHPPLWHLILAIPAKLGVPFEIGLKTVGIIISVASASLLLFFSKLPRFVRLALPFSYFFFYQYGVIVRPYGLMLFIMLLLGMNFSKRKEHPWRIFFLLALLCLCSAYGIVLAGGIAICLVIEIVGEKGIKQTAASFFKDPRILSLLALLAVAVILILEIMPWPDTYYAGYANRTPWFVCLLCALLTFPAECFLTSSSWFSIDRSLLQTSNIGVAELTTLCVIGIVVWILIICSASRKNLKFLLVPYVLLAVFSAVVYFSGHHLGVVFVFLLFWAEYISRENDRFEIGKALMKKIVSKEKDSRLLKRAYLIIGIICLAVPIYWTATASVNDVIYEYYYGRSTAAFLKDNGLENCLILSGWVGAGGSAAANGDESYVNTSTVGNAVPVNAYFDHNLFFNLNHNNPEQGFMYYREPPIEEAEKDLEEWRAYGMPDIIVGKPKLEQVYGSDISYEDYSLVALVNSKFIWKNSMSSDRMPVFLRNDLLEKYELEALEGLEYISVNGLRLTDEMKERYYNGESMEDILDPYLDAMFGEESG